MNPLCYLAVWACVVPPSVMQHAILLGRDGWMRFNQCSERSLPPRLLTSGCFGELAPSHHAPTGVSGVVPGPLALDSGFHLRYDGAAGSTLSDERQPHAVNLVYNNGLPALTGRYLVEMLPQLDLLSVGERFAASTSGRQVLPLVGAVDLESDDFIGVVHAPFRCALPLTLSRVQPPPTWRRSRPFRILPAQEPQPRPIPRLPCSSVWLPTTVLRFLRVWARLPPHLRDIAFDSRSPEWTRLAIEQLGDAPLRKSRTFSPNPTRILVPAL